MNICSLFACSARLNRLRGNDASTVALNGGIEATGPIPECHLAPQSGAISAPIPGWYQRKQGAIMRLILTAVLCCWALSTAGAQDRRGYLQDMVISDGPIIYGTGMNDADRQKAWKHFYSMMVKTVVSQQGQDALGVKLARRCRPSDDFCTTALDVNLVGIGGIQEPRTVLVVVVTDVHDHGVAPV
jgi:hypothetical protein